MKKAISLILAFVLCLSLCACGKSEAVKNVEALIEAIGEITIESETAIVTAEEAYNALPDEEKTAVGNYNKLVDAKAAFEYMQFKASLVGDWVALYDNNTVIFSLNEDGTASIQDYVFNWELAEDKNHIKLDGAFAFNLDVGHIFEYVTLDSSELNDMVVKKEDAGQIVDKYFNVVEMNEENYSEYIGESIFLGYQQDSWGNDSEAFFCFTSRAFESGLIYMGVYPDFVCEIEVSTNDGEESSLTLMTITGDPSQPYGYLELEGIDPNTTFMTAYHPYQPFSCSVVDGIDSDTTISIANIKGSVIFISSEYVADIHYSEYGSNRIISLIDGNTIIDRCHSYSSNNEAYYKWVADADILF